MLNYIHEHFAEQLTLSDISRTADIGERDVYDAFGGQYSFPPMQYFIKNIELCGVQHYFIQHPSASISGNCSTLPGFDSPSNFAKMFRRFLWLFAQRI